MCRRRKKLKEEEEGGAQRGKEARSREERKECKEESAEKKGRKRKRIAFERRRIKRCTMQREERGKTKGVIDAGAAMKRSLLKMLKPELVIVEEAAECLEAQVLSSLPSSTKQLVLIGDHLQLRWAFSLVLSLSLSCVGVPLPVPSQPRHLTGHLAPATSTFASTR